MSTNNAQKAISALCRTCAEKMCKAVCKHSDAERAFTSVYCLNEISYSLSLGYQIVEIFEAYIYFELLNFFREFMDALAKNKVLSVLTFLKTNLLVLLNCLIHIFPDKQFRLPFRLSDSC